MVSQARFSWSWPLSLSIGARTAAADEAPPAPSPLAGSDAIPVRQGRCPPGGHVDAMRT